MTDYILAVKGEGHNRPLRSNLVNTIPYGLLEHSLLNLQGMYKH